MRVVLDTNVLISAALKPGGLEAAVVEAVVAGRLEAWVTPEVWAEYEEVLARPKFAPMRAASQGMLDALSARVQRTTAINTATSALDEDDNRFIECADAAKARYLVTGNLRHYPAAWGETTAVNARGLFDATGLNA
ncbi:MAG TPA: putative toxin-antitoxin system toxin component, PIN family [Bryobacteraceae bacterium]|nr:putative toxin-antitoxin system toxin component, PIN family [Bryobacteraceae bacterium]